MSYDVSIVDEHGERMQSSTKHGLRGGTYNMFDTTELWLSVTYNYGPLLTEALGFPLTDLDGRAVISTIEKIALAYAYLQDDDEKDYWKATSGNVKRMLLNMGLMAFHAKFEGLWNVK